MLNSRSFFFRIAAVALCVGLLHASSIQVGGSSSASVTVLNNSSAYSAITNTSSETFFGIAADGKITAGLINAPKHRIETIVAGVYSTNSGTSNVTVKIKLCTVSGCGSGTVVQLASTGTMVAGAAVTNQAWSCQLYTNVFTSGASATLDTQGICFLFSSSTNSLAISIANTSTATVDTTVDEYVSVSVTWNETQAADTVALRNFAAKVY